MMPRPTDKPRASAPHGVKIRSLRKRRGWSQVELAERAGITNQALSLVERGERVGKLDTLRRVAAALGVSLSRLVG
jgi:transcriptional regulator with XRE-family HTH domain